MEKVDLSKLPKYKGDFIPIPGDFQLGGIIDIMTKKGIMKGAVFVQDGDNLKITLFADQLRQEETGALLVSQTHWKKQLARAVEWSARKG